MCSYENSHCTVLLATVHTLPVGFVLCIRSELWPQIICSYSYKWYTVDVPPFGCVHLFLQKRLPPPLHQNSKVTSVMIYHRGASLSEQHTDLLICHCT